MNCSTLTDSRRNMTKVTICSLHTKIWQNLMIRIPINKTSHNLTQAKYSVYAILSLSQGIHLRQLQLHSYVSQPSKSGPSSALASTVILASRPAISDSYSSQSSSIGEPLMSFHIRARVHFLWTSADTPDNSYKRSQLHPFPSKRNVPNNLRNIGVVSLPHVSWVFWGNQSFAWIKRSLKIW